MKLPRTLAIGLTIAAFATTPAFAAAQDEADAPGNIDLSKYDLETEEGAYDAYRAIKNEVEDICELLTPSTGSRLNAALRECQKNLMEGTMATVKAPLVVEAYEKSVRR